MAGNSGNEGKGYQGRREPLISVIIPAYNSAGTIAEALESVLAQDVVLEIIVLDDCSTDNLDDVMAGYSSNPVIRYVKNEKNLGVAKTRNKGVDMAAGAYIAFLDADDRWREEKLKKQLRRLEKTRTVLCATGRELMNAKGDLTGKVIPVREGITYKMLLGGNAINCSSVVIEKKVAKEFPMEHADSHEDYLTWLKVLKKYGHASAVNEPLLLYRLTNGGKSGSKLHSARMTFKVYRYMGFGVIKSCWCFVRYALNGVLKYVFAGKE